MFRREKRWDVEVLIIVHPKYHNGMFSHICFDIIAKGKDIDKVIAYFKENWYDCRVCPYVKEALEMYTGFSYIASEDLAHSERCNKAVQEDINFIINKVKKAEIVFMNLEWKG